VSRPSFVVLLRHFVGPAPYRGNAIGATPTGETAAARGAFAFIESGLRFRCEGGDPMNRNSKLLVLAAFGVVTTAAIAGNAHFVRGPDASLNSNTGNVTVTWKEAGLGDTVMIDYEASADGTARYQCVNRGGNCPAASNKQEVHGPVSATGSFASGKNGSINGSLTFEPPASTLVCPGNQRLVMTAVSYTNIALEDLTNNLFAAASPSSLSMAGPECP
jgi:hypothetical protein